MPPQVSPIPVPELDDYGQGAVDWLNAHGLTAKQPPIRSSDLHTARSCEFLYYLKNRLGIQPAIKGPGALLQGSLFHMAMESLHRDGTLDFDLYPMEKELREKALEYDLNADDLVQMLRDDYYTTQVWAGAAAEICPLPKDMLLLDTEVLVEYTSCPKVSSSIVARFDAIVLYKGKVWVLDYKTTKDKPRIRMSTVPFEFQSILYMYLTENLLPQIKKQYDLPTTTEFGGAIHYCVQKPTIKIRKKDVETHGPDEAQAIYLQRCSEWFRGAGEFDGLAGERSVDPAIDISFVTPDNTNSWDFVRKLKYLDDLATRAAEPKRFMRSDSYIRDIYTTPKSVMGLSIYAPFYIHPVAHWPQLVDDGEFERSWRDVNEKPTIKG